MNDSPIKRRATKLRDAGYSYKMINVSLGVSKSTLSNWFKDKPFIPNQEVLHRIQYGPIKSAEKSHNKKVAEIEKLLEIGTKEIGRLSKRDLWLLGIGLYIGEGTKTYENVRIVNSDPIIARLAIKWFKEICHVDDTNITVTLHIYSDNDIKKSIDYWSMTLSLPKSNFRKTQIDSRKDKSIIRNKKLPYGTAHINIIADGNPEKGVRLHRKLMGWINGVLSQIK